MEIRQLEPGDREALERFLRRVPESDRTFFKEDVEDPAVIDAWVRPETARVLAVDEGEVLGYSALVQLHGWSSHVGEVRVIVDPDRRGRGVGRMLARRAVLEAVALDLTKVVVEVISDQEATILMFRVAGVRAGGAAARSRARSQRPSARPAGARPLGRRAAGRARGRRDRR